MKPKAQTILQNKDKTIPILSFPSAQLLGISVSELIGCADNHVKGMKAIAERCDIGASLNMMDLSVEAEAFGATIHFADNEIPTVTAGVIDDISQAESIAVPEIGAARTRVYIDGIKKAKQALDRPVFCGIIGPYSLAGRLLDMTELMMACFDSPDEVHTLLTKATDFLIKYLAAFKEAGADGVILAEPAGGLLSPSLAEEFSTPYVKKIFDSVNDEGFIICYHNCGNAVTAQAEDIASLGADIYHFGNSIRLADIIPAMPTDSIVMGNIDPLIFRNGSAEDIENAAQSVYNDCRGYDNFMLSSGCDIPYDAKWENIDAYFKKIKSLYQ